MVGWDRNGWYPGLHCRERIVCVPSLTNVPLHTMQPLNLIKKMKMIPGSTWSGGIGTDGIRSLRD